MDQGVRYNETLKHHTNEGLYPQPIVTFLPRKSPEIPKVPEEVTIMYSINR
jgi:hypothetical protein